MTDSADIPTDSVKDCESCAKLQTRLERALRQLERQLSLGEEIRAENENLKQKLQRFKQHKRANEIQNTTSITTQTENDLNSTLLCNGNNSERSQDHQQIIRNGDPELEAAATRVSDSGDQSVADMLREAANECISHNGYVYDEKSGLYYDYNSGYYYDPHRKLFYEPRSGTYYAYDEETREYSFHSRENPERLKRHCEQLWIQTGGQHAPPKRKSKRNNLETNNEEQPSESILETRSEYSAESNGIQEPSPKASPEKEELEEGEISDESEDAETELKEPGECEVHGDMAVTCVDDFEDGEQDYAPCVRLMVTSSGNLTVGTLFIITCAGGTIGRPSKYYRHAVELNDEAVAECACQLDYETTTGKYQLLVKGKGDISINGKRIRKKDGAIPILHRNTLNIGGTEMGVHIHSGSETCDGCEPGVAQAQSREATVEEELDIPSSTSREDQRREEMKRIKSKFGLRGAFETVRVKGRDRAAERRIEKGSDNGFASSSTESGTSAHKHLPETNKGARLLAKMGWKPGQSLGKAGNGIVEPVTAEIRLDPQAGLGSDLPSMSLDAGSNPCQAARIKNWKKMKDRYERLEQDSSIAK